jgi:2-polyprenyl-3-methyl-5-hydroxy-6-metoxy-1,4-benzoquinol methylase
MKCLICQSESSTILWRRGRFNQALFNVICLDCGLIYLDPRPQLEEDFYANSYRKQYVGRDRSSYEAVRQREVSAKFRYDLIQSLGLLSSPGTALDVGSGMGNFLKILKDSGWRVWGVDPDESYTRFGREHLNLTGLKTGYFSAKDYHPNQFNLVSLFHVLEHLDNPLETLREIRPLMDPDSHLVIEVPDIERPYRGDLDFFFQSAHNYTFSSLTLTNLLAMAGFTVKQIAHPNNFLLVIAAPSQPKPAILDKIHPRRIIRLATWNRLAYWLFWRWVKLAKRVLIRIKLRHG